MRAERGRRRICAADKAGYASLRVETNELVAILVTVAKKVKARAL
jgi:hypothetical protein